MAEFKYNNELGNKHDKDMIDICKILTNKGYITKASCEGHFDNDIMFTVFNDYLCALPDAYIKFKNPISKYGITKLPPLWVFGNNKPDTDDIIRFTNMKYEDYYKSGATMKLRRATNEEKEIVKNRCLRRSDIKDLDKLLSIMERTKKMYMNSLKKWANSLPDIEKNKVMTEAVGETKLSPNAQKRKLITDFLTELYTTLEQGGTKNIEAFLAKTSKLSDTQFIALMRTIVDDPTKHLYFEIEAFVNEPSFEIVEKAANDVVGDEYTHLFDYIAFPHLSKDKNNPSYTVHKVFNGYINMRRVQQLVNSKNHIPTNADRRDPKTNQVTQESKAARVSDVEQFALICHGTKNVLKEFFGPRGGDPVMRDEMNHQIATTGTARLSEMHDSKFNKTSLNTANVYLTAAGIENDMVTKNGILPRTIMKEYKNANVLDRSKIR